MKPILVAIVAFLLLSGCSTFYSPDSAPSARIPSQSGYPHLKAALDELLPDTLFPPSGIGMKVVSLDRRETLYELNPRLLFTPASNQKLFTSAAALSTLGEGYLFPTIAAIDTSDAYRICLKGSGDPILSAADLDTLARRVSALIPAKDTLWTLAGDVSRFDDLHFGSGWVWDDGSDPSAMSISPLSVESNCVRVRVHAGTVAGESLAVSLEPDTKYVTIENNGTTAAGSVTRPLDIGRRWQERLNVVTVNGEMLPGDSADALVSVGQPEWYALALFREKLERYGVRCAGMILDTLLHPAQELARVEHRLDSIATFMNKVSDNLSAENLLKTLGVDSTGKAGCAPRGASAINRFLASRGIDTTSNAIADGSGVSRYNLTSAGMIVDLLKAMREDGTHFPAFYHSLPIAGIDGTIGARMRNTPAMGNLRAKTGTLSGVSSLSGYVTTADGEQLVFSMIMENFPGPARAYRRVQDRIGAFLAGVRRGAF